MSKRHPKRLKASSTSAAMLGALLLLVLAGLVNTPTASADEECRFFPETRYNLCGRFLQYWDSHGGLAQQGYPISSVFVEQNAPPPAGDGLNHPVQYFERARFEYHLENKPPYDILLGLLGGEQFRAKYSAGTPTTQPVSGDCRNFPETGFKVCGRFLQYWVANGGLNQQGLPISNVFEEQNAPPPAGDGKVHNVQYFERARFEQHNENAQPDDVLLGLLGREQFQTKYNGVGIPARQIVTALGIRTASDINGQKPEAGTVYVIVDLLVLNTTDADLITAPENFGLQTRETLVTKTYWSGSPLGTGALPLSRRLENDRVLPDKFVLGEIAFVVPIGETPLSILFNDTNIAVKYPL